MFSSAEKDTHSSASPSLALSLPASSAAFFAALSFLLALWSIVCQPSSAPPPLDCGSLLIAPDIIVSSLTTRGASAPFAPFFFRAALFLFEVLLNSKSPSELE